VCLARPDETKRHDDKRNTKTIRGKDVSAKILGRSGKIMIVRSDKDDKDDGKDDKDHDMDKNSDGKDDVDSKDGVDSKDDGRDNKDSVDDKDADNKDDNDDANDKDDNDDDDDFRDDNDDLLSFELDEIEEKDSDGNEVDDKHSVDSFSDVDFQFSRLNSNFKLQGVSTINVNLSTYLDDPKANLDIMVYLFRESGKITFGNETFAVQAGTVKFNIKISNWDFCDDSSCSKGKAGKYLDLSLNVRSKGGPVEIDDDDRKKANKPAVCDDKDDDKDDRNDKDDKDDKDDDDDDCPFIYDMGDDSEMLLNRGVMTDDDDYTAMPAGFPKFENDDGKKKFVFRIPKFSKNVLVDPSVTPGKKSSAGQKSAASWLKVNFTFALLLQVAAMFAAQ